MSTKLFFCLMLIVLLCGLLGQSGCAFLTPVDDEEQLSIPTRKSVRDQNAMITLEESAAPSRKKATGRPRVTFDPPQENVDPQHALPAPTVAEAKLAELKTADVNAGDSIATQTTRTNANDTASADKASAKEVSKTEISAAASAAAQVRSLWPLRQNISAPSTKQASLMPASGPICSPRLKRPSRNIVRFCYGV